MSAQYFPMKLKDLRITAFRNYDNLSYSAHQQLNLLVGPNGVGKTNLLDAIYYAALGRSYFSGLDRDVVMNGSDFMRLEYRFEHMAKLHALVFKISRKTGKKLEWNKQTVEKVSEYIGRVKVVMMAPQDAFVLLMGNTERRKWLDQLLCQYDKTYASHLKHYQRVLSRRNSYLKSTPRHKIEDQLLDIYWDQMREAAQYIHQLRLNILDAFNGSVQAYYAKLSDVAEEVSVGYESVLDSFEWDELKKKFRKEEIQQGVTQAGIHKDKLLFRIDKKNLKYYGSQGQTKCFFIALKLAEYELLTKDEIPPILLVDDVFAKLDGYRIKRLFEIFRTMKKGQIFITDTNYDRMVELLDILKMNGKIQRLSKGRLILEHDEQE